MAQKTFPTWATTPTTVTNGDPSLEDPGATLKQFGWDIVKPLVQHFNWMFNIIGYFIKANNEIKVEPTTYEAEIGESVLIDNSTANSTGLLPALPLDRQKVSFGGTDPLSTYSVTISGNGNDIMELGVTDLTLDINDRMYEFTWDTTTSLWEFSIGNLRGKV